MTVPVLLIGLNARYPNGSLGEVVTIVTDFPPEDVLASTDRATDLLSDAIDGATARYHTLIGPAYGPGDFVYTLYPLDSMEELFDLAGERIVRLERMPDYVRPVI